MLLPEKFLCPFSFFYYYFVACRWLAYWYLVPTCKFYFSKTQSLRRVQSLLTKNRPSVDGNVTSCQSVFSLCGRTHYRARFHSFLSKRETADRLFSLEPRNRRLLACKTHQLFLLRAKQTFLLSSLQMWRSFRHAVVVLFSYSFKRILVPLQWN